MPNSLTRRGFLATGLATGLVPGAMLALPGRAGAADPVTTLRVTSRVLDIGGRAATVFGIENQAGGQGLTLDPGARFSVRLQNDLAEPTLVHWHGQIPPNLQDGVPGMPLPPLAQGQQRDYDFAPMPGTFWMHSHIPTQEMTLLAAPLIVRSAADARADRQEVTLFLHDFSFTPAAEILAGLGGGGNGMAGMDHGAMGNMSGMDHSSMAGMNGGMAMDLNDIDFDAYLANDRTLDDPDIVRVDTGGRVLLRAINAASATVFWIDLAAAQGRLVAVDGHPVAPVTGSRFGFAMAQRLDIEIDLPADGSALPVLALREGAPQRTGIILAPAGAKVPRLAAEGDPAPAFDLALETQLRATHPLAERRPDRDQMLMLDGTMQPYLWTINGATWGDHHPIAVRSGERVELTFHNMSMMAHPMHLHGHMFQVVALNGNRFSGALRDTVQVPPMAAVTVAFDAGEPANWMLHCHHMPHLATGMMTELAITG